VNDVVVEVERADQGLGRSIGDFFNRFSETFARMNLNFQQGVRGVREFSAGLEVLANAGISAEEALEGLIEELERLGGKTASALPKDSGLTAEQVTNRLAGFEAAEVRARISGSSQAILDALQAERAFLEQQLERQFVKDRPALQRKLESALLGVVNDIDAINRQAVTAAGRSAAESKRQAEELARQRLEADRALLEAMGVRREDAANRVSAAAAAGNAAAQLKRMDAFQALIQKQITKVRQLIEDEKLRRDTIRLLRLALAQSRREEEALRAEQVANAIAEREESIRLDIENAQITGNRAREIALQKKLIADLERQVRNSKLRGNALKELKNELARERARLKELQGETETTKNAFAELSFEFLQTQQGFAANLFSNLIPSGITSGLVGGRTPQVASDRVVQAAGLAETRGQTTTQGQTMLMIDILRQMLQELRNIRSGNSHPEARNQRNMSAGAMEMM
jgi:hypothetical protein